MKIVFTANGRCASAAVEPAGQPITAGSRGIPAEIHLSQDYEGLVVTAFFRSDTGAWPVVLGETPGTVTIPWEAMEKKSLTFDVGVVGKNGDGTVVIPTIWARAGKIVPATEDSGLEPGDPSADIGAQIVEQARAAAKKAEDAAAAAEAAIGYMPKIVDGTWWVYDAEAETWTDTGIQAEGQDGVGISGAVLNADYTLTLTFSDGTSYTTPPIRGRQGEPGPVGPTPDISIGTVTTGAAGSQAEATMTGTPEKPVLNLTIPRGDPGEVTQAEFDALADEVADQKSAIEDLQDLTNRKAGMLVDSVSGAIASFTPDATIDNLLGVSVAVEPVQDLHGYDNPWPGGGGVNKWDEQWEGGTINTSTGENSDVGLNTNIRSTNFIPVLASTEYYFCHQNFAGNIFEYDNSKNFIRVVSSTTTFTTTASTGFLRFYMGSAYGNSYNHDLSINYPSTATSYAPYKNLCPISGWTGAKIQSSGVNLIDDTLRNNTNEVLLTRGVWYAQSFVTAPSEINTRLQYFDESNYRWINVTSAPFTTDNFTITTLSGHTNPFGWMYGNQTFSISIVNPTKFRFTTTSLNGIRRLSISPTQLSTFVEYAGSNQISVTFPSEAGTVYGGSLDVTNGTMTVDRAIYDYGSGTVLPVNNSEDSRAQGLFSAYGFTPPVKTVSTASATEIPNIISTTFKAAPNYKFLAPGRNPENATFGQYSGSFFVQWDALAGKTNAEAKTLLTGVKIVSPVATPVVIQLDPVTISTISGQTNNLWADAGDVDVAYAADIKAYIDKLNQPTEDDMIANTLIQSGKYFTINNRLFLSTASIAVGAQIIPGTNCTETSLVEALNALNA